MPTTPCAFIWLQSWKQVTTETAKFEISLKFEDVEKFGDIPHNIQKRHPKTQDGGTQLKVFLIVEFELTGYKWS